MKACLHTVSYAGLWGQAGLSIEETIDKASELGFDGIMPMAKRPHISVLDASEHWLAELKARLDDRGLSCACVAGYTNFTGDAEHADIPSLETQIHHIQHLGRIARSLGCTVVRVFTGYESQALGFQASWRRCAGGLAEAGDRVADLGVTLAVQNHHDIGAHHLALRELIEDIGRPNVRVAFDAWAPTLQGENAADAVRAMAPHVVHTTAADYTMLPRHVYVPGLVNYAQGQSYVRAVPIGEGIVDYAGFLSALGEGGYSGFVGYEMCSPLRGGGSMENLDRCARRSLEFIKGL